MNEREASATIARLAETVPDRPAPLADLLHDAAAARRRRRHWNLTAVVVAASLLLVCGVALTKFVGRSSPGPETQQPTSHGSLTNREYAVAVKVAQQRADKSAISISSATATAGEGKVADNNIGHPCTSGTLLHITLIGVFHGIVVPAPPQTSTSPRFDGTVTTLSITADPASGYACLLGVHTGKVTPDPGATVLSLN